jgi:peptidyl-prolyl cis-trans isomerase SurA
MNLLEATLQGFLDTSWRASGLILLVLGFRRWIRAHLPARLLFWVWIAVAVRLLWPVSLPAAWSPYNLVSLSKIYEYTPIPPKWHEPAALEIAEPMLTGGPVLPSSGVLTKKSNSAGEWAALIWVVGAAALLLSRVVASLRFARTIRHSASRPNAATSAVLTEALKSFDARGVKVLVTNAVCAPALYGIFRPRILFPSGFLEKLSLSELRLTLAHELAHVRRRDLLADVLIHLSVAVHWFNPLVWLAARAGRDDCELACDEAVLCGVERSERESYGATLLRIAQLTSEGPTPRFALGVVTSKAQIKRRIQMIIADKSFPLSRTLLCAALSAAITGLSFTSELTAQIANPDTAPFPNATTAQTTAALESSAADIVYNPSVDRLDVLFPTGVVATVGDRSIAVADVRQYTAPLIPKLKADARTQDEFNGRLAILQNSAVKDLVARALLIRQFHDAKDGAAKQIPGNYIDNSIADEISERFGGDRSKFLAYLKERGLKQRDYRKQVEEQIIYNYMRGQERKMAGTVQRVKSDSAERPIRLRIIQLTRADGESDAALLGRANEILGRFRNGESFEILARQFDESGKREQGGDWGWQGPPDLRSEFRDAVLALKKGEISAPILAKDSCLLFYAEDRR